METPIVFGQSNPKFDFTGTPGMSRPYETTKDEDQGDVPPPPPPARESITVDDDGDLIIEAGLKDIRVASKILCFASPVFDAMFSSRFAEGTVPRSSTNPLKLPLPEDDAEAMERLLHVIHFNRKRSYDRTTGDEFLAFAQLVDKYDCCVAAYGESRRWYQDNFSEAVEPLSSNFSTRDLWKLSAALYLLDQSKPFEMVTRELAHESKAGKAHARSDVADIFSASFECESLRASS